MKLEIRTLIIMLCAALMLTTACKKTPIPAEDPQPSVVDFRASSQATWVKSAFTTFSDYHSDFGVWGIARQDNLIYNLWGNSSLMTVVKNAAGSYVPNEPAYWLNGYTYNFLAVAPHVDAGLSSIRVTTKEDQTASESPSDYMTYTYDMSTNYASGNYTFDLLGAAAEQPVNTSGYNEPQQLFFWHLLSKLSIKVIFVDANGTEVTSNNNAVTNLSISNVNPKGNFTLKYIKTAGSTGNLSVVPVADSQAQSKTIDFDASSAKDENGRWNAHIIPQTISNFVIDIAYNVTGSDGKVTYYNDSISLASSTPATYAPNGQYNWTIRINPKGGIGFTVDVAKWGEEQIGTDITID
jgi:hypothetical protein